MKNEVIFVHNLNFDGYLIIEKLSSRRYNFKIFAKNLNLYNITIFNNSYKIEFKCSYKILPISLSNIAHSFKLSPKLPFPYKFVSEKNLYYKGKIPDKIYFNKEEDHAYMLKNYDYFSMQEYSTIYCMRDVEITKKFLEILSNILKIFKIKLDTTFSAPSLAFKIFQKKFNKNKIKLTHNSLIDNFARKSYFGGRCEVYGNPSEGDFIFHYDFTGMYAQCMMEKFPIGKYELVYKPKKIEKCGIYCIEYESKDFNRPILPHHRLNDGKLIFSNGKMKGWYASEEIQYFIKKGGIVNKILYGLVYENTEEIFSDYVSFFTDLRKVSSAHNVFGKLMINSLYGRLGMQEIDSFSFVDKKEKLQEFLKKLNILSFRELNDIILVEAHLDNKLEKYLNIAKSKTKNNVVIASIITSKARLKLYEAQNDVIFNNGKLLYSDTDSIFASYKKDVSNEKHGVIKWDTSKPDTVIKNAWFFSPKSYIIKYPNNTSVVKIKGFNEKGFSYEDIWDKFKNNEKLILPKYKFLNKKDLKLRYVETMKEFDLKFYDKRCFSDDFKKTTPLYYENYIYRNDRVYNEQ